ncbi:MAG: hypothetical protein V4864_12345 [Pseudomonadota bacterium]
MVQPTRFANRSVEIARFRGFVAARNPCKRAIVFRAPKSSGASEFLRHLAEGQGQSEISIYMDMAAGGVSQLADALKECRDQRLLCRLGNFLQAAPLSGLLSRIATISSGALPLLARIGATALMGIGEGILVEPFPSTSTSRICRMAVTWPKPDVYFFLDNVQKKASEIIQLARACASDEHYAHVRFVLAVTDENEGDIPYASFRRRLPFHASMMEEENFQPIDARFVAAISAAQGLEFQHDDCDRLAKLAGNDMWSLLDYIEGTQGAERAGELSQMCKFLVRLLCVAAQPLRRSDMRLLVLRSEQIVGTPAEFDASVEELRRMRLIDHTPAEDGDSLVVLATDSAVPVRELKQGSLANLSVARDLYDFFSLAEQTHSSRHSDAALAQLLYRLAHEIDPASVPVRAQALVRIAMSQGSVADAERYIEIAQRRQGMPSLHDFFVQVALFVSLEDFAAAKAVLDRIARSEFDRYRILRILDAVALNRIRDHDESDRQIDRLLAEGGSDEERALLVSYKIGGLLHAERWQDAGAVLDEWAPRLRHAKNHPYFLRNAAAVHMLSPKQDLEIAEQMLGEAVHAFSANKDAFGEATALCNYGVVKALVGDIESAERHFRRSYSRLSVLGTQHIQESGTNLGTALMLLGEFELAQRHMVKLLPMMEMNYPRAITEANLAILDMLLGRQTTAVDRVRTLVAAADEIGIVDCARHIRFAGALIESVAGQTAKAASLLNDAEARGGTTRELSIIRQAIAGGPLDPRAAFKLYRKDWMQYWSQNPLQMLPAATLTAQPKLDHVT